MKKAQLRNYLIMGLVAAAFAVAAPLTVSAQSVRAQEAQTTTQERQEAVAAKREAAKVKLTEAKLKLCQGRETVINTIITRTDDRIIKQLAVFAKISDRTQAFYVKSGKVLASYDSLVADVTAKKATAEATIPSIKVTFACDGADPKGVAESFKTTRAAQRATLKEYKTSVKNLIVGVKSVQGTTAASEEGKQ